MVLCDAGANGRGVSGGWRVCNELGVFIVFAARSNAIKHRRLCARALVRAVFIVGRCGVSVKRNMKQAVAWQCDLSCVVTMTKRWFSRAATAVELMQVLYPCTVLA